MQASWFWCTLGGLHVVVRARSVMGARMFAADAFREARRGQLQVASNSPEIKVRRATARDMRRWDQLIEQSRGGVAGARVLEDAEQGELFAA
jgi:hypothetical protein